MVAYSFQRQFIEPIQAETKHQTIRARRTGRTPHAVAGVKPQLYFGMRTKQCRLIGLARCSSVEPCRLQLAGPRPLVTMPLTLTFHRASELDAFAVCDGFADWTALVQFWQQQHEGITDFDGVRICWDSFGRAG